jgi:hypothetical protein
MLRSKIRVCLCATNLPCDLLMFLLRKIVSSKKQCEVFWRLFLNQSFRPLKQRVKSWQQTSVFALNTLALMLFVMSNSRAVLIAMLLRETLKVFAPQKFAQTFISRAETTICEANA